jgi:hypothetical protein
MYAIIRLDSEEAKEGRIISKHRSEDLARRALKKKLHPMGRPPKVLKRFVYRIGLVTPHSKIWSCVAVA